MRTHVTFRHPAERVPVWEADDVLSTTGVDWFLAILRRIPGLAIHSDPCQEDWGVVVLARRDGMRFWIGISLDPGLGSVDDAWMAHLHHGVASGLQRVAPSGARALELLACDLHAVLQADPEVTDVTWFTESEMGLPNPKGAPKPVAD